MCCKASANWFCRFLKRSTRAEITRCRTSDDFDTLKPLPEWMLSDLRRCIVDLELALFNEYKLSILFDEALTQRTTQWKNTNQNNDKKKTSDEFCAFTRHSYRFAFPPNVCPTWLCDALLINWYSPTKNDIISFCQMIEMSGMNTSYVFIVFRYYGNINRFEFATVINMWLQPARHRIPYNEIKLSNNH